MHRLVYGTHAKHAKYLLLRNTHTIASRTRFEKQHSELSENMGVNKLVGVVWRKSKDIAI